MENNSKRQKTGRQLWGQFDFSILRGNMRCCPGSLAKFGVDERAHPFEAACVLKPQVIFADYGEGRTSFVRTFQYDGEGYPMP
ncbi:hypothetical protein SLS62_005239 [Diatrype stigma]|uniref:Uncharacterized protein n=1 Tax=Diatrype stigma TaxID=117547 RepID=A0AAN9YNL0_9PEZI